jgi:hypothetical protein
MLAISAPANAASAFATQAPRVSGSLTVGSTLTTTFPTWNPMPTATGYRWSRDGVIIPGATHSTYTLTSADYGHDIWASIIGARSGFTQASRTKDLGRVGLGTVRATSNPVLHGTPTAGNVMTVTTGGWSVSGLSVRYQWLRNGSIVSGQTGKTYSLTGLDIGSTIAARIIVSKAGYADASARSQVTGAIGKGSPSFSGDGTLAVGSRVQPGTYFSSTGQDGFCEWSTKAANGDETDADYGWGQRIMTVKSTDASVTVEGCGSWSRIALAGPHFSKIPAYGVFKVGQQIAPGTWQTSNAPYGCVWALYSSGGGYYTDNVIDSGASDDTGTTTVSIPSTAYSFETNCNVSWTKIG